MAAGSVVVNLIANTQRFVTGMKQSRKSMYHLQRQAIQMRQAMYKLTAVFAGASGISYTLKKFVNSASDAVEIMNKFNVVFGSDADATKKWADSFADGVGRSRKEVAKWLSGLQDTFVPLGYARDKAADLSKQLVELAVDVGSFNNKADDEVIRDFTSALVGNHEAVRKYGIIITETSMKQRAMREGLDPKALKNLEKVQLRYNAILGSTSDAQGDAKRTAESYANQVKRLDGNMDNLRVTMGSYLVPTFSVVVEEINNAITGFSAIDNQILESQAVMLGYKAAAYETAAGLMEVADIFSQFNPAYKLNQSFGLPTWAGLDYAARHKEFKKKADDLWTRANREADKESGGFGPNNPNRISEVVKKTEGGYTFEQSGFVGPPDSLAPQSPETFSFNPQAREIDTSQVSIQGLSMMGESKTIERKQTSLLEQIAVNTREMANQEVLN